VKGVSNVVELRIRMESKDQALVCANSLFENIRNSQNQVIKPYIEEAKSLLVKYQSRLEDAKMIAARGDKPGFPLSAAYLINREEVNFLTDESIRLNNFITAGEARQAKLISPIYISEAPVFPDKKLGLILGVAAGLFLGFLVMLAKRGYAIYKVS
jgi:capsular polysaccharide biosynthesis protein